MIKVLENLQGAGCCRVLHGVAVVAVRHKAL